MDGKNHNWMELDELGHMAIDPTPVLRRVAWCPYCGRFMRRGLVNFLEHAWGDCPHHKTYIYSPKEDDITQPNK